MFDHTSRYYLIETLFWDVPGGAQPDGSKIRVAYKRRRFLPQPEDLQVLAEWPVEQGDRFDLIAARTLGDSQSFWRVADANRAMDPDELTDEPGRRLAIPMPTSPETLR
jgi:hypothetical protein